MNQILALKPAWCAGHLPAENGVVHVSAEQLVQVGEQHTVYVSIEQALAEPVAIRLEGAGSTPMSPAQAMHLAHVLQSAAFAALSGGQVAA